MGAQTTNLKNGKVLKLYNSLLSAILKVCPNFSPP